MKRINMRMFNRNMYIYLKDLPFVVYNKKTGKNLFEVRRAK